VNLFLAQVIGRPDLRQSPLAIDLAAENARHLDIIADARPMVCGAVAASGNGALLRRFMGRADGPGDAVSLAVIAAAEKGHVHIVEEYVSRCTQETCRTACMRAIARGHCSLAEFFIDNHIVCVDEQYAICAANGGRWRAFSLVTQHGALDALDAAADDLLCAATNGGNPAIVAVALRYVQKCNPSAITHAACTAAMSDYESAYNLFAAAGIDPPEARLIRACRRGDIREADCIADSTPGISMSHLARYIPIACRSRPVRTVEWILDRCAKTGAPEADVGCALYEALCADNHALAAHLIKNRGARLSDD